MAEREELSWDQFGAATRQLASSVVTDGFAPDLIPVSYTHLTLPTILRV